MSSLATQVRMHRTLAHPARVRILHMLQEGPLCGCQIIAVTKLAASTVSGHLAALRDVELVTEKKEGRWVEYSITAEPRLRTMIDALLSEVTDDPRIRADRTIAKALRKVPLDELCGVDNDLERLERAGVAAAVQRADAILGRERETSP